MRVSPEKFPRLGSFPQREIAGVGLFVAVDIHASAGLHAAQIELGQPAVGRGKFGYAEIDGAVAGVGEPPAVSCSIEPDHVLDMIGSADEIPGSLQAEGAPVG